MSKHKEIWKFWKGAVDAAVANVCLRIIREPLMYFSEADAQQLLVEELRAIEPVGRIYPTSVRRGKGSKGTYDTSLLHREYGGGGGTRVDVVLLAPEDVAMVDDVNLTLGGSYLKPAYAFELGTEKTSDALAHLKNDLKKLGRQTKGVGYVVHIYKDVTQARTGTRSRQRTEEKITRDFKRVFGAAEHQNHPDIKVVAILLRTYRNQPRMRGKCEIFDGGEWRRLNISKTDELRSAILRQLA